MIYNTMLEYKWDPEQSHLTYVNPYLVGAVNHV